MTRQDIVENFTVSPDGIIQDLGKFEGEMLYVPYFWDAYLNGMADEDDGEQLLFTVSDEDRSMFPELTEQFTVILVERSDGFVVELI